MGPGIRSRARHPSPALLAVLIVALGLGWLAGAAPGAAADGPTTFSNAASIAIPATGSADQTGPASPYPSTIAVSGMAGAVTTVTAAFNNLTHGAVNDIDALLVAPTGASLVLLSDIGDPTSSLAFANSATLTFSDAAPGPVPTGNIPTGTYRPTSNAPAESFPAPAPAPSTQTTLAGAFTGINPNGTWSLYVVDDNTGDVGTMAGGWSLTVTTEVAAAVTTTTVTSSDATSTTGDPVTFTATVRAGTTPVTAGTVQFADGATTLGAPVTLNGAGVATLTTSALTEGTHVIQATFSGATGFLTSNGMVSQRVDNATVVTGDTYCNPGPIAPPAQGAGSPYPSNVFVTGQAGEITKVTATLRNLSHSAPIDFDVLLSGPAPATNVVLLSDAGGQSAVSNLAVTFDDAAARPVPSPLTSGTFRPTDDDSDAADAPFPAPAPAVSSATQLATFNGSAPNGTWSLWVVDDASGDTGSIAGGWCLTVTALEETATALTSSLNPSTFGDEVTFTATVTAGGAPVTEGSVQFSDGGTNLGTPVAVNASGVATFTTVALAVGSHPIAATYAATDSFGASGGTLTQVVDRASTETALTSSVNPSDVGESVTFTATVTDADGDPVTSGSVQFGDDGTALGGPVALTAAGTATFTTATLTAGTHPITATFVETAQYAESSDALDQVVARILTATVLTSSVNPSQVGQLVTFTATVTDADGDPVTSGSVQFGDGGTALGGPVAVDASGIAELPTAALTAGTHPITATFVQTAQYAGSTSDPVSQVVGLVPTTTELTSAPNPSDVGEDVTFTAAVIDDEGDPLTSGTVQFSDDGTLLGTGVLGPGGEATFTTSTLPAGIHPIRATFVKTAQHAESFDELDQVVEKIATTTVVESSPDPSDPGDSVTFTATVTRTQGRAPVGVGVIIFTIDGTAEPPEAVNASGVATISTSDLEPGRHQIEAAYSGDDTFAVSEGTDEHLVNPIADAGGPYTVAEGASLTLDGSDSTDGALYAWDVNGDDVFTDALGEAPTLTWTQLEALGVDDGPSTYPVGLRVTLGGRSTDATAELTVTNTAPASVLTGDLTATIGVPFTIKVGADDPSSADMRGSFAYTVDWGDGSPVATVPGPADPPVRHVYVTAGQVEAVFTATDKDGDTGSPTSVTIQVQAAQITPTPTPSPTDSDSDDGIDLASTGSTVGIGTMLAAALLLVAGATLVAAGRRRSGRREG